MNNDCLEANRGKKGQRSTDLSADRSVRRQIYLLFDLYTNK